MFHLLLTANLAAAVQPTGIKTDKIGIGSRKAMIHVASAKMLLALAANLALLAQS